jgi:phosphoglycolate phosphatase-like HAD superfamily hydrolase
MIHCVAFDFDGTLADSNEIKRRAYFAAADAYDPEGAAVRAANVREPHGDRYAVSLAVAEELRERGLVPRDRSSQKLADELAQSYGEYCERQIAACPEIPGASLTLRELTGLGIELFVNTATPRDAILPILAKRGMDDCFAGVYGGPASKLENLRDLAESAGAGPTELLVVGDGEDDRVAAQEFGCHFVGIHPPGAEDRFKEQPEHCLPDLRNLSRLLAEVNAEPASASAGRQSESVHGVG